jgi:hypothetical protein
VKIISANLTFSMAVFLLLVPYKKRQRSVVRSPGSTFAVQCLFDLFEPLVRDEIMWLVVSTFFPFFKLQTNLTIDKFDPHPCLS